MDCKEMEEIILTDYTDGRLSGSELKEVEGHLAICAKCRTLANEALAIGGILREAGRHEAPAAVWEKIRSELGTSSVRKTSPRRVQDWLQSVFFRLRPAVVALATVAVALLILVALRLMPQKSAIAPDIVKDDILILQSVAENGDESVYDFGTVLEEYFL